MENRKSPIITLVGILIMLSAGTTVSSAQESFANQSHAFIDRFYTDEAPIVDRNRAATTVPESALPIAEDRVVQTQAELTTSALELEQTGPQDAVLLAANRQRVAIDETLVKPTPVRQLSCRPY